MTKITYEQILAQCQNSTLPFLQIILQVPQNLSKTIKFQYIVQKFTDLIRLPMNTKFTDYPILGETGPLRQYLTNIQKQTNMIIQVKQYTAKILLSISVYLVSMVQYITPQFYKKIDPLQTKQMSDDLQIILALSKKQLRQQCTHIAGAQWMQCLILIVVEPIQRKNIGNQLQYSIQFRSSSNIQLKQYQPVNSVLNTDQSQFYYFYPSLYQPKNTTKSHIGVQLSTQNQKCIKIYINRYYQLGKHLSLINQTSQFNIFQIDTNSYIIEVVSTAPNCHYSLEISVIGNQELDGNGRTRVNVLHPDVGFDLSIAKDQVRYFIVEGVYAGRGDLWKIYYMRKYGQINIYGVQYSNVTEVKIFYTQTYQFKQTDFPIRQQFPNTLQLPNQSNTTTSKTNKMFIIAIKGISQQQSQGTLKLHNNILPLIVPYSKMLRNSLNFQQSIIIKYYFPHERVSDGEIRLNLVYGKIKIQAFLVYDQKYYANNQHSILISDKECCMEGNTSKIKFKFPEQLQQLSKDLNSNILTQSLTSTSTQLTSEQINKSPQYLKIKLTNLQQKSDICIYQITVYIDKNQIKTEEIDKGTLNHIKINKWNQIIIKTSSIFKLFKIYISGIDELNHGVNQVFYKNVTNRDKQKRKDVGNVPNKYNKQLQVQQQKNSQKNPPSNNNQTTPKQPPQINNLLDCIDIQISSQNQQKYTLNSIEPILNNVLSINVEKVQYFKMQRSQLLLQVSIKQQCPIDSLFVTITPNLDGKLTILSPYKWSYLQDQKNFAVAAKQDFLIDVVGCSGPVDLYIAKDFPQLQKNIQNFQKTSYLGNQPHVFKITPTQTITYFKIKSKQATIRYINPNFQKQTGVGYHKYRWDYFQYETDFQKLVLSLKPIRSIGQTKTKVLLMTYLIKIIEGLDIQKSSLQCMQVGNRTIYTQIINSQKLQQTNLLISKQVLLQQLKLTSNGQNGQNGSPHKPQNLYISIDLSLLIKTPQGPTQVYKFLAPVQQIPIDIFNITRLSNKMIGFGIISIVCVIFGCLVLAQCFLKYVVPILGRFQGSNQLVQEQIKNSKQLEQVPVSSDRNQRVTGIQEQEHKDSNSKKVQTQQQMTK